MVQYCLCFVVFILTGCQSFDGHKSSLPPAVNTFIPLQDIARIPQDPLQWSRFFDPPHNNASSEPGDPMAYRQHFFKPWHDIKANLSAESLIKRTHAFASLDLYGPHLQTYELSSTQTWVQRANLSRIHTLARYGILVRDADERILPSHLPCFYAPHLAGESYPFDECQNDRLYVGTPVYVSHLSSDKGWAYVSSARSSGWVPSTDVAWVRPQDLTHLESRPLATFIRDQYPVLDARGHFIAYAPLGAQLPLKKNTSSGVEILWPSRDQAGYVRWDTVRIPRHALSPDPLTFTSANALALLKELSGQPYGWGTFLGHRDCSAMTKDYFAAFHIFIMRNSKAQAAQGHVISLKDLTPEEKKMMIVSQGIPLRTILYAPGHVGIYVGSLNQEPLMMHARWGNKTQVHGREGRNVIGRAVVTTLEWGKELPNLMPGTLFVQTLESMSVF